jgi:hypothetical protein
MGLISLRLVETLTAAVGMKGDCNRGGLSILWKEFREFAMLLTWQLVSLLGRRLEK